MQIFPEVVERLSKIGYKHKGDLGIKGREAFKLATETINAGKDELQTPAHHLYVCPKDSESLAKMILFRDILRKDNNVAISYENLKKKEMNKYQQMEIDAMEKLAKQKK